jgi:peptide/nickel transport system substrate-binding protein
MRVVSFTRRTFLTTSIGASLSALAPATARAQSQKILRVRTYGDINSLDPAHLVSTESDGNIAYSIYSNLITYEPSETWKWRLDAAESIDQVDPTHIRFKLRPGIKWTGGFGEMTADDVKFSFERVADPATKSEYQADWAALDHVEVTDKYGGTIVLKVPYSPLFTTTLPWGTGHILSRKAVEAVGGSFSTQPPATSGPYFFKTWTPKQKIVLARNPDYFGQPAAFDEIHILPITEDKTAELAFEAGEIDYTQISVSSIPHYRDNPPKNGQLLVRPSETYYWIGMNTSHELFRDIRVRQAIQHGVDVDEILSAAFFNVTPRATGIVAPGLIGHRDANLIKGPNLDMARKLLAEAGKPEGFTCTLSVLNQSDRVAACEVIQSQLARIGVKVEIRPYDSGAYWSLGAEKDGDQWKDLQLMFLRYTSAPDPSWATVWFTCEQVGIFNWERWCNEEYTRLHNDALKESDPAKRHPMYVRMQDLMEESGAYIFVTHEATAAFCRTSVLPANMPNNRAIMSLFQPA